MIFFSSWFEPFVSQWLSENDEVSMEFMIGAFDRDIRDEVNTFYALPLSTLFKIVLHTVPLTLEQLFCLIFISF